MNAQQPQTAPKGRKPADPPPPPKSGFSKYKLPEESSFFHKTAYHACYQLQCMIPQKCKNDCDNCLYQNSSGICISESAKEIMKNIEKRYGVNSD
jgi:hypothetical protein